MKNSKQNGKTFGETLGKFFKPDKRRIVISAISMLTFFAFFLDDTLPHFLQVLLGVLLFLPIMILIMLAEGVIRGFYLIPVSASDSLFYAIILFWSYVLACLLIFAWNKSSKSKAANGGVG